MADILLTTALKNKMRELGIESFHAADHTHLPADCTFEPPCSIKWMGVHYSLDIGAFSYAVNGYYFNVAIGRYASIGESVQIGRGSHPTTWLSTSPAFYIEKIFNVGTEFENGEVYQAFSPVLGEGVQPTSAAPVTIENDVYIGHGAFILPGVTVHTGAIVAACAVVVKDVPPYAVVAGNPAVVKKMRIPENLVEPLLATEWWRFAPWQLKGLNLWEPDRAIGVLEGLCPKLKPYSPQRLHLAELATI
jgi:acetyltransferase-like isoleucine patch superfamily enzyme